ncbi:MAG: response regulator [Candidatus Omnitrophica bacterium]|nr:response regulator [Candidatus Omnitrophota bacterium]
MSAFEKGRSIEILIVENNPADVRLIQEALVGGRMSTRLHVARDGAEALAFLHGEGKYTGVSGPDLILLDLNLPKKDGREVLVEIKEDENLKHIPVVVLTTSSAETDILKAYNLHANCYITKPVDLGQFMDVVRSVAKFWITIVNLPGVNET